MDVWIDKACETEVLSHEVWLPFEGFLCQHSLVICLSTNLNKTKINLKSNQNILCLNKNNHKQTKVRKIEIIFGVIALIVKVSLSNFDLRKNIKHFKEWNWSGISLHMIVIHHSVDGDTIFYLYYTIVPGEMWRLQERDLRLVSLNT